jgi:hypothetical protein
VGISKDERKGQTEIMAENLSYLMKNINVKTQEVQCTS